MKRHWQYLKYIIRHKLFVIIAGRQIGVSLWRLITHDMSKFLPCEWFPYANCFYKPDGSSQYIESAAFAHAWNHHQKSNKHHWQYWILDWDSRSPECLKMPESYVREMVADWAGAGRAITGSWDITTWALSNRDKIRLHPESRELADKLIAQLMSLQGRG